MNKVLSVSIASYNVENSLEKAVYSILNASNAELVEIIIVNDGSIDNTLDIAEKLKNQFPDIIRIINKDNGGYGSTIEASLSIATGRYFKLLDGDDLFDTEELENYLGALLSSEEDMIISPFLECYLNGKTVRKEFHYKENQTYGASSLSEDFTMHSLTYKTDILKQIDLKFPHHCLYTDNLFCFIPLYHVRNFKYIDRNVYRYSLGAEGQSVSKANLIKHIDDISNVVDNALDYYNNTSIDNGAECIITRKLSRIYYAYIYTALLCPPCNNTKRQIVKMEKRVKNNNPEIYHTIQNLKMTSMRMSNYVLYPVVSWYIRFVER